MTLAMFGQSIPSFWLGIMMILFFGLYLRWFPISGHVPFLDAAAAGRLGDRVPQPAAVALLPDPARRSRSAFYSLSRNARLVRSSMLEVLGQDYVRTARSKGISERAVVIHHALRNAWLPVVTMIGLEFGFLLGGVVVIETVFSWPGHRPPGVQRDQPARHPGGAGAR